MNMMDMIVMKYKLANLLVYTCAQELHKTIKTENRKDQMAKAYMPFPRGHGNWRVVTSSGTLLQTNVQTVSQVISGDVLGSLDKILSGWGDTFSLLSSPILNLSWLFDKVSWRGSFRQLHLFWKNLSQPDKGTSEKASPRTSERNKGKFQKL